MSTVTIREEDEAVSVFIDGHWVGTYGCEERHVRYVYDTLVKWYARLASGRFAPSPMPYLILGEIVTWWSDSPGVESGPGEEAPDEEDEK